ncbi:uncharacterized protein LOC115578299 [Sparus aurata]|uniref:uncharacterized protein LOC115578299 n=1 Tax=Sparus aurata TaxID=8175 RepID=UPI0011C0F7A7|nr:uncharacterized protein LOC115578299 [Sparus aurata]
MPLSKSRKRSEAAKKRIAARQKKEEGEGSEGPPKIVMMGPQGPPPTLPTVKGTGRRHRVNDWEKVGASGRPHKVVLPEKEKDHPAVLIVGDSHLRSCVDRIVPMDAMGGCTFGFSSTPGASAKDLRKEVVAMKLPDSVDALCLLAPSNNLTSSRTIVEAGEDFAKLLSVVCSLGRPVFVVGFPRRLNVDMELQNLLSDIYHRKAALEGVKYFDIAEYFPTSQLDLWSKDGVHLSDNFWMPKLVECLAYFAYLALIPCKPNADMFRLLAAPKQRVRRRPVVAGSGMVSLGSETMPGPRCQIKPQVVVTRSVKVDSPRRKRKAQPVVADKVKVAKPRESFDWQLVGGNKRTRNSPKSRNQQQELFSDEDCIPVSPVRFPSAFLDAGLEDMPSSSEVLPSSSARVFTTARRPSKRVVPARES